MTHKIYGKEMQSSLTKYRKGNYIVKSSESTNARFPLDMIQGIFLVVNNSVFSDKYKAFLIVRFCELQTGASSQCLCQFYISAVELLICTFVDHKINVRPQLRTWRQVLFLLAVCNIEIHSFLVIPVITLDKPRAVILFKGCNIIVFLLPDLA